MIAPAVALLRDCRTNANRSSRGAMHVDLKNPVEQKVDEKAKRSGSRQGHDPRHRHITNGAPLHRLASLEQPDADDGRTTHMGGGYRQAERTGQ